jgi:hypothetical protein
MFKKVDWQSYYLYLIIFILPVLIYIALILLGLESHYGTWTFIALYYLALGIIGYYHTKVFHKNHLINDLDEKFGLTDKLNHEKKNKTYHDFTIKALLDGIKESQDQIGENHE